MLLCHRKCGLAGIYTTKKGLVCCHKTASKCPAIKSKIGKATSANLKGKTYEEIHGANASIMRKKRVDNLTGRDVTNDSREKSRQSNKKTREQNPRDPWNKGLTGVQIPWNKGKTGYSMPSRRKISDQDYNNYQKYKRAIYSASRKTYKQNINQLNPKGLLLGRSGIPNAYQIDHIVPISIGYQLQIPVMIMSLVENLQLMLWKDNLKKSNKDQPNEEILNMLVERSKYIKELTS